ncbi:flagellar biosynthesis anti-sigma factor FlgM [Luteimonas yindakuii]|uniref:Negative regulator of flagellin synthesis n=1 Tax=Luteimonas yindakuii TaxID=2565782 RepID=A0A4Z1RCV3_9GAMM|nr:flagellar biosynthesis anti-sigma factor FlgM [Luteimonas yindakuii]QCO67707.1 flagellar biosynthesis anti-sigma factor FlgM [Luteimonas yindakuii]TKS53993.1 flagellar biosynthesis anti-sigma factor FlgM [Luteimonas yindakuii]
MTQKIEGLSTAAVRGTGPALGQVSRAGDARKAVEAPAAADSLRLTGEATGLQALQRDLATRPALDESRVQAVREALASGSYRIDPEAIASRMLELDAQLAG